MEIGRAIPYDILISASDNKGFFVRVGCGQFVFGCKDDLLKALEKYLTAPEEWEKKYGNLQITPYQADWVRGERTATEAVSLNQQVGRAMRGDREERSAPNQS